MGANWIFWILLIVSLLFFAIAIMMAMMALKSKLNYVTAIDQIKKEMKGRKFSVRIKGIKEGDRDLELRTGVMLIECGAEVVNVERRNDFQISGSVETTVTDDGKYLHNCLLAISGVTRAFRTPDCKENKELAAIITYVAGGGEDAEDFLIIYRENSNIGFTLALAAIATILGMLSLIVSLL